MVIKHRCKLCNEYTEVEVSEDNYFKWLVTKNVNDLDISELDKILLTKNVCNSCRIATKEIDG